MRPVRIVYLLVQTYFPKIFYSHREYLSFKIEQRSRNLRVRVLPHPEDEDMLEWPLASTEFRVLPHPKGEYILTWVIAQAVTTHLWSSGADTVRMIVLSLLVGYPKWKVRCSVAANFPRWRYQGYRTSRTHEIQVGGEVNNGIVLNLRLLTSPGPAHRYN